MNRKTISEALGGIDEGYIIEALSGRADLPRKENETMNKKVRSFRPARVAVIAAVLALVLAVSVFAVEVLLPEMKLQEKEFSNPITGDTANGFTTVVECDGDVVVEYPAREKTVKGDTKVNLLNEADLPVRKLLQEQFSDELRALASETADSRDIIKEFDSFQAAEEYIGFNVFTNSILDNAAPTNVFIDNKVSKCWTSTRFNEGNIIGVTVHSAYNLGYVGQSPLHVYLTVKLYSTECITGVHDMFGGYSYPDGYTFSGEEYVTPGGLDVMIVSVYGPEGDVIYYAQMGINGAAVTLNCYGHLVDMDTLKEILDAFEA